MPSRFFFIVSTLCGNNGIYARKLQPCTPGLLLIAASSFIVDRCFYAIPENSSWPGSICEMFQKTRQAPTLMAEVEYQRVEQCCATFSIYKHDKFYSNICLCDSLGWPQANTSIVHQITLKGIQLYSFVSSYIRATFLRAAVSVDFWIFSHCSAASDLGVSLILFSPVHIQG